MTNFTKLFSPFDFQKKWQHDFETWMKVSYIEAIDRTNLTNQTKFRLNEISKIENYFNQEIKERKINSKKLSKYVAAFDYIDKISIALSATSGGVSIISFTTVIGTPVGIANASFAFIISLTTGIIKKQ